jgi:hypothetical protein
MICLLNVEPHELGSDRLFELYHPLLGLSIGGLLTCLENVWMLLPILAIERILEAQ